MQSIIEENVKGTHRRLFRYRFYMIRDRDMRPHAVLTSVVPELSIHDFDLAKPSCGFPCHRLIAKNVALSNGQFALCFCSLTERMDCVKLATEIERVLQ
jgi:hypothetical protein